MLHVLQLSSSRFCESVGIIILVIVVQKTLVRTQRALPRLTQLVGGQGCRRCDVRARAPGPSEGLALLRGGFVLRSSRASLPRSLSHA